MAVIPTATGNWPVAKHFDWSSSSRFLLVRALQCDPGGGGRVVAQIDVLHVPREGAPEFDHRGSRLALHEGQDPAGATAETVTACSAANATTVPNPTAALGRPGPKTVEARGPQHLPGLDYGGPTDVG